MHRKNTKQRGFVLVLSIALLALIGTVLFVLTEDARTILFQSNTAYLQAVQRNLVASGLAWAKQNINSKNEETFDKTTELDTADFKVRSSTLHILIDTSDGQRPKVQIETLCERERLTLRHKDSYTLKLE